MRKSPISARSSFSISGHDAGWSPSTSMRLAWRIAAGPNRAPGRFEGPGSKGMPATQIVASAFERSRPRKAGRVAKVGTEVMASYLGRPCSGGRISDPFEHCGDTLADADAHRHERISPAGTPQLAGGGQGDARTRGAQWVADRNRAAVHVDAAVVERQFEAAQAGQHLGGEGLVDLDHVDVREAEPGAGERLFRGFDGADAHDPRRHSRD